MSFASDTWKVHRWLLGLPAWLLTSMLLLTAMSIAMAIRLSANGPGPPVIWIADVAILVVFWGTHLYLRVIRWRGPGSGP